MLEDIYTDAVMEARVMLKRLGFACFQVFCSIAGVAAAQTDRCAAALIQDHGKLDLRQTSSLALAELYRQSISNDKNWAAGVTVPIEGVPLSGSAESAESTRESFFRQSSLDWSFERVESVATQTLSDNAVEAYRICKDGEHRTGPRILAYRATREGVTVEIRWISGGGAPTRETGASIVVEGGTVDNAFPTTWETGDSRTRFVRREPGRDIRIRADIGPGTDSIFISRMPDPPATRPVLEMAACTGHGDFGGFRFWGPRGEWCNGLRDPKWGRYDADPRVVTQLGSCTGPGGSVEGLTFWGPVGAPCLLQDGGWGTYQNPVDISSSGIASCPGGGKYFSKHYLWGPAGKACFGLPEWGAFDQGRVISNAER
ncbi:hypothetical protein [Defluviimonas salinarum]|uniref:hypothetical protein n=1 Tax=Defluviimonas salinarum TaxID=2992147 RepID=UPI002232A559|nr:hypothetical protein [Defluviimonas salinarum]